MPAADMVLSAWDVPQDFFPAPSYCGPLDHPRENAASSFVALFRPESPVPVIISQALVFPESDAPRGYVEGVMQALVSTANNEFGGPALGEESHYFEGKLDGDRLYRYTALWRYPGVFCEVAVAGPPGRFTKSDLQHYAAIQDKRATSQLTEMNSR